MCNTYYSLQVTPQHILVYSSLSRRLFSVIFRTEAKFFNFEGCLGHVVTLLFFDGCVVSTRRILMEQLPIFKLLLQHHVVTSPRLQAPKGDKQGVDEGHVPLRLTLQFEECGMLSHHVSLQCFVYAYFCCLARRCIAYEPDADHVRHKTDNCLVWQRSPSEDNHGPTKGG